MPRYYMLRGVITHELERETSSIASQSNRLSPTPKNKYADPLIKQNVNVAQTERQKARSLLAAFEERDFVDPERRSAYRALRAIELGSPQAHAIADRHVRSFGPIPEAGVSQRKIQPETEVSGSNKKRFDPTAKLGPYAVSTSGVLARARVAGYLKNRLVPGYNLASKIVPCIDMHVRREVMFARQKAGKGYKVKHRYNPNRVPC